MLYEVITKIALGYAKAHGHKGCEPMAADADATYERRIRIDVTGMSPQVACPHLPDNVKPVEEVKDVVIHQSVIGSCTNGRISDLRAAAEVLKGRKVAKGVRLIVLPATPLIWRRITSYNVCYTKLLRR